MTFEMQMLGIKTHGGYKLHLAVVSLLNEYEEAAEMMPPGYEAKEQQLRGYAKALRELNEYPEGLDTLADILTKV